MVIQKEKVGGISIIKKEKVGPCLTELGISKLKVDGVLVFYCCACICGCAFFLSSFS